MRELGNYLPEIEKLAEKQLKAAGHVTGALTHRTVSIMAQQLGFELIYVNDLPHSARSVTDLENGRIYLPPASIPGGHGRSEEHTSELQSLMRISYAVFCL